MSQARTEKGFTLIELLIVMAILAIIGAIALPLYLNFVQEAQIHATLRNSEPLRLALEDFFLENGTYIAGDWQPAGAQTLQAGALSWHPDGDENQYNYNVAAGPTGIATSYILTVQRVDGSATAQCTRDQTAGTYACVSL